MTLLDEVEFFTDDGSLAGSDEDAIDFGARPVPRWAVVLGAALVAIVFVGTVVTRSHPSATASRPERPAPPAASLPALGAVGPVLQLGGGAADALDTLVHRDKLYVLRSIGVSVVDLATKHVDTVRLTGGSPGAGQSSARLLLDADTDRLWVVRMGVHATGLVEFNVARMIAIRQMTLHLAVRDAAALDGHLYLATSTGLADLAPAATRAVALPGASGAVSAVAADPARNRILALDVSTPYSVVVVSARGVVTRRTFGNLINGTIAIVGDAIWVGGYGGGARGGYRALVARLDPATLAPVQTSAIALQLDRVVVSAGTRDIWVSTNRPGLWCLDASTGNVLEHWPSAVAPVTSEVGWGPVISRVSTAYVIEAGSLRPLVLAGCAG